jgi:hypothetical protein
VEDAGEAGSAGDPRTLAAMPRSRTIVLAALVVLVVTDVTWDGRRLLVSIGWPGRKPLASFAFPRPAPDLGDTESADQA